MTSTGVAISGFMLREEWVEQDAATQLRLKSAGKIQDPILRFMACKPGWWGFKTHESAVFRLRTACPWTRRVEDIF